MQITILAGSVAEAARELGSARPGDVLDKHDFLRLHRAASVSRSDQPCFGSGLIAQLSNLPPWSRCKPDRHHRGLRGGTAEPVGVDAGGVLLGRTVSVVDPRPAIRWQAW